MYVYYLLPSEAVWVGTAVSSTEQTCCGLCIHFHLHNAKPSYFRSHEIWKVCLGPKSEWNGILLVAICLSYMDNIPA